MEKLNAKQGCWLTQSSLENDSERVFFKSVTTANASLWAEVTDDYKATWENEHPRVIEEEQG